MASLTAAETGLLWRAMRVLQRGTGHFTVRDLVDIAGEERRRAIPTYINALLDERVIVIADRKKRGSADVPVYRVDRNGDMPPPFRSGTRLVGHGQRALWTTMRQLAQWTVKEAAFAASTDQLIVTYETANNYVRALLQAGYLDSTPNVAKPTYRLIRARNTGPLAPIILPGRRACYDLNLMQMVGPSYRRAA